MNEHQNKKCSECQAYWKTSELIDKLFCPRCLVISDTLLERLAEQTNKETLK